MKAVAPPDVEPLISRLPRTFGPALKDQFRRWDSLFPAEQRQLRSQCEWLGAQSKEDFRKLFAPLIETESKMVLPHWDANASGISVQEAGLLARSPFYAQWRRDVATVFAKIDDGVQTAGGFRQPSTLLMCILPSGLPLQAQPLWAEQAKIGRWMRLGQQLGQLLPSLVQSLADRKLSEVEPIESTWVLESDAKFARLPLAETATVLSWAALEPARREFLKSLNSVRRDLASVDQTHVELGRLNLAPLIGPQLGGKPILREFVRALLLSGNGSLIFGNSFVQWGASEALRRAQPQVLLACFGVRQKLKPFSSTVLFEDQNRSNPVRDDDDPAGSLIDGMMLANYVYLAAQRNTQAGSRRLTLFGAADLDRVLVLGGPAEIAPDFSGGRLAELSLKWLQTSP